MKLEASEVYSIGSSNYLYWSILIRCKIFHKFLGKGVLKNVENEDNPHLIILFGSEEKSFSPETLSDDVFIDVELDEDQIDFIYHFQETRLSIIESEKMFYEKAISKYKEEKSQRAQSFILDWQKDAPNRARNREAQNLRNQKAIEFKREKTITLHKTRLNNLHLPYRGTKKSTTQSRTANCWACWSALNNYCDDECCVCGWIICQCGACGCGRVIRNP